ncbi:MAG: response regulator [Woeseia sp.]
MKREAFVTTRQAANLLNVSLRTIQLWTESGVLSAWKTAGGHRRVSSQSVEKMRREQYQATHATAEERNVAIVIVEDDPLYRELYQLKIAAWGLPTVTLTANDGFEALLTIGRLAPQIVITDLGMPGMDGFQMIRSLQESSTKLEVIVITGLSDREIERAGGLPESVKLLKKPAPLSELEVLLRAKVAELESS